jgi:hypothetical protein
MTLDVGPTTNHVNFAHNANGTFAYLAVGRPNEVKVLRLDDCQQVATIPIDNLPHAGLAFRQWIEDLCRACADAR